MVAFALTCAGALSCLVLRAWTVEGASIVASRRLHRALLDRVLRAPMGESVCVCYNLVSSSIESVPVFKGRRLVTD